MSLDELHSRVTITASQENKSSAMTNCVSKYELKTAISNSEADIFYVTKTG